MHLLSDLPFYSFCLVLGCLGFCFVFCFFTYVYFRYVDINIDFAEPSGLVSKL